MGSITVRLPDSIHKNLRSLAKKDRVSINQLISSAVTEKVSALMTEDYLEARAARASREAFDAALAHVPSVPPEPYDDKPPES
ncbi:MAG: type II toxin-antitoxin system HicB family antitoxin [Coriobacteriales bacterium]|jgi:predicted transcriptional regulator|nr:type II toxin-antitoxin system HicB family antitoxin [Coriobacteriales bacterium]